MGNKRPKVVVTKFEKTCRVFIYDDTFTLLTPDGEDSIELPMVFDNKLIKITIELLE